MSIGWLSVALGATVGIYSAVTQPGHTPEILRSRERGFMIGAAISLTALVDNKHLGILAGKVIEVAPSILIPGLAGKEPILLSGSELDIKSVEDVGNSHHLLIVGSTGAGKSTLASAIVRQLGGTAIVLDPHAKSTDWTGLTVVGRERNYSAIARMMESQIMELNRRYALRSQDKFFGEQLNIIIDEYPSIASSNEGGKVAPKWLQSIGCEGRKVGMRLVILSQGQNVKTLGIEGQGELRENFTFIRLGSFAKDHAKHLKNEAINSWLNQQSRPAMLDNTPLVIPTIEPGLSFASDNQVKVSSELPSTNGFGGSNQIVSEVLTTPNQEAELWELVKPYVGSKSYSWIIKNVLGCKGANYQKGKAQLDELIERYGR